MTFRDDSPQTTDDSLLESTLSTQDRIVVARRGSSVICHLSSVVSLSRLARAEVR